MRPLTRGTGGFQAPAELVWRGGAIAAAIQDHFGLGGASARVGVDDCLAALFRLGRKNVLSAEEKVVLKALKAKVEKEYKSAGTSLVAEYGAYCAYCEVPLSGLVEVEHIVPKTHAPKFALEWSNFLPSCSACNTQKSSAPHPNDAMSWPPAVTAFDQDDYRRRVRRHYWWPDVDSVVFRRLPLRLYTSSDDWTTYRRVKLAESVETSNQLISVDTPRRQVIADVVVDGRFERGVAVRVLVDPGDQERGQRTVGLLGLNSPGGNLASTYDRRVLQRTERWFVAVQQLAHLRAASDAADFGARWITLLMLAQAAGFYSVWVTVLRNAADVYGSEKSLAHRFVAGATQFPGTNTTNLP